MSTNIQLNSLIIFNFSLGDVSLKRDSCVNIIAMEVKRDSRVNS